MIDRIDGCVITELELLCLASLYGMKKIYGYKAVEEISKKNIHYALYQLGKKGHIFIDSKKDTIKISDDIKVILDEIINVDDILDIKVCNTGERILIYRRKRKNAVIIRQNCTLYNELIISMVPTIYVPRYLEDEGYIKYVVRKDLFTREDAHNSELYRNDNNEDRILVIKRINKEYNIDLKEEMEIYESVIYDVNKNRKMLLEYNSFCSVINRELNI